MGARISRRDQKWQSEKKENISDHTCRPLHDKIQKCTLGLKRILFENIFLKFHSNSTTSILPNNNSQNRVDNLALSESSSVF